MLYLKEKKNTQDQNIYYNNIDKEKEKDDFFSSFRNIKNLQELWLKAIFFKKDYCLLPYSRSFQKFNINRFFDFYNNNTRLKNIKNSQMKFSVTNKFGNVIGLISLIYLHKYKCIFIKKVSLIKGMSLEIFEKAIIKLLDYFRITFYIKNFLISLKKNNVKKETFFKKIGFKKFIHNLDEKLINFNYIWEGYNKNIGKNIILTAGPSVSLLETTKTFDAAKNGWNQNWNKYINDLEKNFAKYIGVKYAISTSSCTGALHIALKSLGVSAGDEVIVPDITWVATARVVTYLGATPVFADIDKETWNIDISSIEKLITNKTKAIIPVHLYGNPANLVGLKKISLKYKISLVEDAAPALGSLYKGKMCGSVGHFSAFSFQGAKLLVAGEGGMLCTNSPRLYRIAKKISEHGRNPKKTFWIDGPGLKYKISNIQAAFASGQLERVKHLILMKRRIFDWYKEFLKNNSSLRLLEENKGSYSNYWMVSIALKNNKNKNRDKLIKFLRQNNIDTRPVFSPISEYPIWNKKQKINKVSKQVGYSSLNLPSGTSLSKNEVRYICKKINLFFNLQG